MLNEVTLIGNVGQDPDIRKTQSGDSIANLSIATSESWKDKNTGERKEKTEWHRVVIFGKTAEIVEKYVTKGSKLYIKGALQTRKWTDKEGVEKYSTEVVVQGFSGTMKMLDSKTTQANPAPQSASNTPALPQPQLDDEIPF